MQKTVAVRRPGLSGDQPLLGVIRLYDKERRLVALIGFRGGDAGQALQAALDAYRGSNPRSGNVRDNHGQLLAVGEPS